MAEKKKKSYWWVWLLVGLSTIFIVGIILIIFLFITIAGDSSFKPFDEGKIGVLRLDGVISGSGQSEGLLGVESGTSPESFRQNIKDAVDDESVKAIVIRVNSPGGTPSASQELFSDVKEARKEKPVYVSISDVGASGAYYAVCPANKIYANPSSIVGSIGVYMEIPVLKGLYEKLGVKYTILKAGKYKTIGDPSRELTQEEKRILQNQVDEMYAQFISDVAKGRKNLSEKDVKEIATGLAYPGTEAKKLGLIDEIGSYSTVLDFAAKKAKLGDDYEIVEFQEQGLSFTDFFESLFRPKLLNEKIKLR